MQYFRKKLTVYFALLLMVPAMFVMQIKNAQAVIPIPVAIGIAVAGSAGIIAAQAMVPGTVANALVYGDGQPVTRTSGFADVPLGSRDRGNLDVPAGWTNSTTPSSTSAPTLAYSWNSTVYSDWGSLCDAWRASWGYQTGQADDASVMKCGYYNASAGYGGFVKPTGAGTTNACAAGYIFNGTTCVISNPDVVMKPPDGRCQILSGVSGFTVDPQDPECGSLNAAGVTVTPNMVSAKGKDGGTNTITLNGDGSRTITDTRISADGKNTIVNNITLAPNMVNGVPLQDGSATVTGTRTESYAGTGTLVVNTPSAPAIDFPDDYNREVTQQQIRTGVDKIHADLNSDEFVSDLPTASQKAQDDLAAASSDHTTKIGALPGQYVIAKAFSWPSWVPDVSKSTCSPFTGSVLGKSISINLCPYINQINALIGWIFALLALHHIGMLFLRPRGS